MKNLGEIKKFKKLISIILTIAGGVILIWVCSVFTDFSGLGRGEEKMINIPRGAGISKISDILKQEGIIKHKNIFRIVEKIGRGNNVFQQGGHVLDDKMSYARIIKKLVSTPEVGVDEIVKVLIPEGYEIRQIAEAFEEAGLVNRENFLKEANEGEFDFEFIKGIARKENRLEGYLFPATYEIRVGETEHEIIERMLRKFSEVVIPIYEGANTEFSLDEVVTLASLVEREAANDSERSVVSSVFHNRMKKDMTLSSCASVQYILKERKPILSNSDIKIKSGYNTYINKGLPTGPIASPGESSIRAALYPEKTDYLYFVALMDGSRNIFSKTGEEHLKNVRKIQG